MLNSSMRKQKKAPRLPTRLPSIGGNYKLFEGLRSFFYRPINSKLQFEIMVNTHLKAMLKRTQYRCDDLSRDRQHARVYHEHKDEFNKCNESILKYAGYLSTDNFFE